MKLGIVAPWRSPSCTREPRELTPSFASHTLAAAARGAGHSVTLASAHPEHAEEAARSTGAEAAPSAAEAVRDAEIVILAIPGDSVAPVIDEVGRRACRARSSSTPPTG